MSFPFQYSNRLNWNTSTISTWPQRDFVNRILYFFQTKRVITCQYYFINTFEITSFEVVYGLLKTNVRWNHVYRTGWVWKNLNLQIVGFELYFLFCIGRINLRGGPHVARKLPTHGEPLQRSRHLYQFNSMSFGLVNIIFTTRPRGKDEASFRYSPNYNKTMLNIISLWHNKWYNIEVQIY